MRSGGAEFIRFILIKQTEESLFWNCVLPVDVLAAVQACEVHMVHFYFYKPLPNFSHTLYTKKYTEF